MNKRYTVSLTISDELYEKLNKLCREFNIKFEHFMRQLLDSLAETEDMLLKFKRDIKVPINTNSFFYNIFNTYCIIWTNLFSRVLEVLNARGYYVVDDFDIDLNEMNIYITYVALEHTKIPIDAFSILLARGFVHLSTISCINLSENEIVKLKERIKERVDEFADLLDYRIEIEEGEGFQYLIIDILEEKLEYLPSLQVISLVINKLLSSVKE